MTDSYGSWRDMSAQSAPFELSRSPISSESSQQYTQSLSRYTSPSSVDAGAASSPTSQRTAPFQFGSDVKERWINAGPGSSAGNGNGQSGQQHLMRKNVSSGSFNNENFLGYGNIWGGPQMPSNNRAQDGVPISRTQPQQSQPTLEQINSRFESTSLGSSHDEMPRAFQSHHQHQSQHQQQGMSQNAAASTTYSSESGRTNEEITTVFIVGFPDDMSEREFANMFLFAKGFEASTLKIPMGGMGGAPTSRLGDNAAVGPGGPYNAVNVPGPSASMDSASWDEPLVSSTLSRSGPTADGFASMTGMGAERLGPNAMAAPGKIKQIIGFAKFRTRADALEARDTLNGRKIDLERGCVLKTEMAKKNLHTKQRPVLLNTSSGPTDPASVSAGPLSAPPFSLHAGGGPAQPLPSQLPQFGAQGMPGAHMPAPPGIAMPNMPTRMEQGPFHPYTAPPQQSSFTRGPVQHMGFDPFTAGRGMPPNGARPNGANDAVTFSAQPRSFLANDTPRDLHHEAHQSVPQMQVPAEKRGPIDYYDNSASQRGGEHVATGMPRGRDWNALGSPSGEYRDAANASLPSASGLVSERGSREAAGHGDESHFAPFRATKEDFGQGESTSNVALQTRAASTTTSPDSGSEKSKITYNAFSGSAPLTGDGTIPTTASHAARPSAQSATSPSVRPMSRLGSLRIDSPTSQQRQHRPFSPTSALRSPPLADMGIMSPGLHGSSYFRATSPGSPPISSPTSRSFSLDANPPGNTLFVGNLPASITNPPASTQLEDALFRIFSQKKGFRQMSFRLKSSGPMCFVEFDDVGCAGRALGAVNGDVLDGMVRGGLRLSFSKHPLFKGTSSSASSSVGHNRSNAATPQPSTPGIQTADMSMILGGNTVASPREDGSKLSSTRSPPR